jgi:hypothetical protein
MKAVIVLRLRGVFPLVLLLKEEGEEETHPRQSVVTFVAARLYPTETVVDDQTDADCFERSFA